MIQLTREEAQQVLDALVSSTGELHLRLASPTDMQLVKNHNAIQTLRARLAEPEQEPVAWFTEDYMEDKSATTYSKEMAERWKEKGWPVTQLYLAPPQREWQGLTDEEIKSTASLGIYEKPLVDFARAIEAKLKEKNNR